LEWMHRTLAAARALRDAVYPTPHYRLVYGESDGLPGLVVDRFGDVCVVQVSTAGMDRLQGLVVEALQAELSPRGILLRNDGGARALEGLGERVETVGEAPDSVDVLESGLRFQAPVRQGQKTGWFFDQRDNRDRLTRYARGRRVLDVFSYVGAWAVRALAAGAAGASCIDSSQPALEAADANARRNGFELETLRGEALDRLKQLRAEGRSFDLVIVDPPALIKRRKDHDAGLEHYAALNRAAMQLLVPGGVLVACSCSFHLEESELQRVLLREARAQNRRMQILEQGGQGPDHPVHPAIPETRYLKAFFCRVN
jgi:23S rRNA (cytosine1962-C5)-methyltransferase